MEQVSIATAIARESGFKTIVKVGHNFAATFFEFRRDFEHMRERAEAALKLSTESREYDPHSKIYLGWADAMAGDLESGVARIKDHTSKALAAGYEIFCDHYLALIATAVGRIGRFEDGFRTIDESLRVIERTGQRYYEAEVHRLKGELLLMQDASNAPQAGQSFRTAIDISRRQKAKSWGLRATTSLARLLDKQGHRDEARAMLAEIYNWFTEGFDTADLKDAKALLEELTN